jgi:hypothetical protein
MVPDGADDAVVAQVLANIGKIRCRPGKAADRMNGFDCLGQIRIGLKTLLSAVIHEI